MSVAVNDVSGSMGKSASILDGVVAFYAIGVWLMHECGVVDRGAASGHGGKQSAFGTPNNLYGVSHALFSFLSSLKLIQKVFLQKSMPPFSRDQSVASSATIGRTPGRSEAPNPSLANPTADSEDIPMPDAEDTAADCHGGRRFIVAVDYGTTNSSASYAIVDDTTQVLDREHVHCIANFPEDPLFDPSRPPRFRNHSNEVPSEVWYPGDDITDAIPFYDRAETSIANPESSMDEGNEGENPNGETEGQDRKRAKTYWRDVPDVVRWGFDARPSLQYSNASGFLSKRNAPVKWAKLQLADNPIKAGYPVQTRKSYNVLKHHRIVRKELDFITDFLTRLFQHIKKELQDNHDLQDGELVEMVLSVPVIWSCKGRRDMYAAVLVAMKNANLGVGRSGHVEDLFDVPEPEAAAAYVLDGDYDIMVGQLHRHSWDKG